MLRVAQPRAKNLGSHPSSDTRKGTATREGSHVLTLTVSVQITQSASYRPNPSANQPIRKDCTNRHGLGTSKDVELAITTVSPRPPSVSGGRGRGRGWEGVGGGGRGRGRGWEGAIGGHLYRENDLFTPPMPMFAAASEQQGTISIAGNVSCLECDPITRPVLLPIW